VLLKISQLREQLHDKVPRFYLEHKYIYTYMNIYLYIHVHVCRYISLHMYIYVCVSLSFCLFITFCLRGDVVDICIMYLYMHV